MPAAQVPSPWPKTGKRQYRLHMDFAGPVDGYLIFILVDAETKWIEARPVKTATTDTTVQLLRESFARFGIPQCVVSDNRPQFSSGAMAKFLQENCIRHLRTAPYHPQSNGLAERAVRTIKEGLKKNKRGTLQEKLSRFLFRYRSTPLESGKSPAQLLFGFQPRTRLSAHFPDGEVPAEADAIRKQFPSANTQPLVPT